MNIYSFSVLCFSFGVLMTAILALVKREDQIAKRFAFFSISVCGWGFLFSLWISQSYSIETTITLIRISYFFVVFIPITWLHFVFDFIGKKEPFRFFYLTNYALAVIFMFLSPTQWMFTGLTPILNFKYIPVAGVANHFHYLTYLVLVSYGLFNLVKTRACRQLK